MKVDIEALGKLPVQLDRLADDATESKTYLDEGVEEVIGGAEPGIINFFVGEHAEARAKVDDFLGQLGSVTAPAFSEAVTSAIEHYESADEASAADVDSTITVSDDDISAVDTALSTLFRASDLPENLFDDREEPTDKLKSVDDYNNTDGFGAPPSWWDLLSPTSIIVDVIYGVTYAAHEMGMLDRAYNVRDEAVKPLVGDWAGVRACADYYSNIASALDSMASNLTWAAYSADACWDANASNACKVSLIELKEALGVASSALGPLSQGYIDAAIEINGARAIVTGLISELYDAAIIATAAAGLAGATAKTVVGGVIFGGLALWELYCVVEIVQEIITLLARCNTYAQGIADFLGGFGIIESGGDLPSLPSAPSVPGG